MKNFCRFLNHLKLDPAYIAVDESFNCLKVVSLEGQTIILVVFGILVIFLESNFSLIAIFDLQLFVCEFSFCLLCLDADVVVVVVVVGARSSFRRFKIGRFATNVRLSTGFLWL